MKTAELIKKAEELLAKCSDGPWIHGGVKYKHWRSVGKREDGGANFKHPNGCKNYGIAILDGKSANEIYTPRIVCEILDSDVQFYKTFREDAEFIIFARNHMQELIDKLKKYEEALLIIKTVLENKRGLCADSFNYMYYMMCKALGDE